MADKLLKGKTDRRSEEVHHGRADQRPGQDRRCPWPCSCPSQQVNKDNVDELVVKSGFQKARRCLSRHPVRSARLAGEPAAAPAGEKIKVGLSFSDFATERWKNERVLMREAAGRTRATKSSGQEANHDVKLQNDQIDNMVTPGRQGPDRHRRRRRCGRDRGRQGRRCRREGHRLRPPDQEPRTLPAYISFNNVEVGRQQALAS